MHESEARMPNIWTGARTNPMFTADFFNDLDDVGASGGTALFSPRTPKAVTYHEQSHYCRSMIGRSLGRMNISY